ncbi:SMI1/KNR4 family protein (plasmid) [Entomospira entomophila]|uniref:SMI1/KNR4 family protein n=1 Tax=Entomospira entomophila TaxID=2719988 RepID=A0A968KS63_9SPIO|nr:SMI1/KNR4 family protein [Entomospira entomophilus]NIZ41414.1 SMI1/KNR4 family protein [Entomospira entomophilus]WDI36364.1 SMI1/KNR4 family protein [Entomospira entomophilus]
MQWNFVEPIENEAHVQEFWNLLGVTIPPAIQATIIAYNGGAPERDLFCTKSGQEHQVGYLLSYNADSAERYDLAQSILLEMRDQLGLLIPLMSDESGGNYICYRPEDGAILFWDHETNHLDLITSSWEDFLNHLYDE